MPDPILPDIVRKYLVYLVLFAGSTLIASVGLQYFMPLPAAFDVGMRLGFLLSLNYEN